MGKVTNEFNRVAGHVSTDTDKRRDGNQTQGASMPSGRPPPEVLEEKAKKTGAALHRQATDPSRPKGPEPGL